jgi:hypothetical protein
VAVGSSWYHLWPNDAGLAIDRAAMSVAFAGLLGLLVAGLVSDRAGAATAGVLLVLAPASVVAWVHHRQRAAVGGGAVRRHATAPARRAGAAAPGALAVRWSLVLLAYALAKLFEVNDHALYAAGGELLSGHSLKHLAAALAACPVIHAVVLRVRGQNAPTSDAAPLALARRA